jgi:hypothetical protein
MSRPTTQLQQPLAIRRNRITCTATFKTAKFCAEGAQNAVDPSMKTFWQKKAAMYLRRALAIRSRIPADARQRFPYLAIGW